MNEEEFRKAVKEFLGLLIKQGYGKSSDKALPAEFDELWNELKND